VSPADRDAPDTDSGFPAAAIADAGTDAQKDDSDRQDEEEQAHSAIDVATAAN
jgi:hypothetical protein